MLSGVYHLVWDGARRRAIFQRERALPGPIPAVPAPAFRRRPGPRACHTGTAQRCAGGQGGARLPFQWPSWDGQDVDGAHIGDGPQLRGAGGWGARRHVCLVRLYPVGLVHGRLRARRRLQPQARRDAGLALPRGTWLPRTLEGIHRRRGPPAHVGRRQRSAQNARRTAVSRRVRAGHHRPSKGPADDPVAHAAL